MAVNDNLHTSILPSAARTAAAVSPAVNNHRYRGGHFAVRVTAKATTGAAITPTIQGLVPGTTGTWYTVLAGAAIASTGTTILKVYPGIAVSANVSASDVLPRVFRVSVAAGSTASVTYTVNAALVE